MGLRLRLISWNLHGVPVAPRVLPRLRAACEEILRRAPDVVLLQEVWMPLQCRFATALLAREYRRGGPERTEGGLLAFARVTADPRLERLEFEPFRSSAPAWKVWEGDGLAGKGIQRLELAWPAGRAVLLNTHLQAAYRPGGYTEVRRAQLRQLAEAAVRVEPDRALVVAGDLNTRPAESELLAELGPDLVELTRPLRERCGCGSVPGRSDWIDYVFARAGAGGRVHGDVELIRSQRPDDPFSDHHGLAAELRFDASPGTARAQRALAALEAPATRRAWLAAAGRLLYAWASA